MDVRASVDDSSGVSPARACFQKYRHVLIRPCLLLVTIALGIGSRSFARFLPAFVAEYAGDTLWATAAFLGFGLVWPAGSIRKVAALAMAFATLIELSQLYHAPWIDSIRHTALGGLILGYEFVPSDLVCYAVGVALGAAIAVGIRTVTKPGRRSRQ
ncbi:MAG TPA: DUF2809 domain-containing protein [Isosphaeraceae bacterium]|jgi:hypothetical protein|nr:DUF2809 domain-containing protein [Isosphaeraceae bacterium]